MIERPAFPWRSRRTRIAALVALSAAVTVSIAYAASLKPTLGLTQPLPIAITARPIASFARTAGAADVAAAPDAKLIWRGGLVLTAATEFFGGYSGLVLSQDGRDLLAVSDAGGWLRARVDYDGKRPVSLSAASIGSIPAMNGQPLRRDKDRDAEELALLSGTLDKGEVLVSFERVNRIVRYRVSRDRFERPLEIMRPPPGLSRFSDDGMEAMTLLKGGPHKGRMVAFTENAGGRGRHAGWIWTDGAAKPLNVVSRDGFSLTAAASLDDGTLLLLERRYTLLEGVRMRLRRIEPSAVQPGALLDGEVLIEADMSDEIDNMEGLAVHTDASGETVLTLISDDNFNSFQRTLLLQFTLPARNPS